MPAMWLIWAWAGALIFPPIAVVEATPTVVDGGSHKSRSMVSFATILTDVDVGAIRSYVITEAVQGYAAERVSGGK